MSESIEVVWKVRPISAGQPRPYADSVYESEIELDGHWYTGRPDFGREVVKRAVHALVRPFAAEKGESRQWHEAWLESLEKIEPHLWRAVVIEPYLD